MNPEERLLFWAREERILRAQVVERIRARQLGEAFVDLPRPEMKSPAGSLRSGSFLSSL